MTPPYLFISFTALLLTPGTRKRPPQSGSVQTWLRGSIELRFRPVGGQLLPNSISFCFPFRRRVRPIAGRCPCSPGAFDTPETTKAHHSSVRPPGQRQF